MVGRALTTCLVDSTRTSGAHYGPVVWTACFRASAPSAHGFASKGTRAAEPPSCFRLTVSTRQPPPRGYPASPPADAARAAVALPRPAPPCPARPRTAAWPTPLRPPPVLPGALHLTESAKRNLLPACLLLPLVSALPAPSLPVRLPAPSLPLRPACSPHLDSALPAPAR